MNIRKLIPLSVSLTAIFLIGCPSESPHDHSSHDHAKTAQPSDAPPPTPTNEASAAEAEAASTAVGGQARDPVCGMAVGVAGKPDHVYRGTRFHFCSTECLEKFKAAPEKASTGLPKEDCVCTIGEMASCDCGHCKGKPERCTCGDPEQGSDSGHDHGSHDHGGH